ncbi:phosphonatase-like hydrolase [Cyclobacterium xiamenense]|uniref:Phosphonatase-like hydrolase n=1 Tax=Cyclobacterium xiamenense TaxID=1297121 RepID=A0A1H6VU94_9BACT|nr:HAD-IA family hydrolase [Cyclobacterium xiamenense]SEJ04170.1 phosphonatase-like hydrolase [Cyclobacterium xiamenense]
MKNPIKLAVFDMAGTTIKDQSNVAEAFVRAFSKHGYTAVTLKEANEKMGYPKPLAIKEMLVAHTPEGERVSEKLVDTIHDSFVDEMIQFYKESPDIAPMDDALEVFESLQQMGIKVGLDTGFSRPIADVILERIGWKNHPLIDITVCSDEVSKGRPHPDMILKMMAALGIGSPSEVIKIGDTEVDINEGLNSGCLLSIAVTTGAYTEAQLAPHKPSHIVHRLIDILPLVAAEIGEPVRE